MQYDMIRSDLIWYNMQITCIHTIYCTAHRNIGFTYLTACWPKDDGLEGAHIHHAITRSEISDDLKLQAQSSSLWWISCARDAIAASLMSLRKRAHPLVLNNSNGRIILNKNGDLRRLSQSCVFLILCIVEQQWLEAGAFQVLVGIHEQTAVEGLDAWSFRRAKHADECKRSTIRRGHISGLLPPGSWKGKFPIFNLFSKLGQNQNQNLWNFAIRGNAGLSLFNTCRKGPEEPKRPWRADYIAFQTELFVSVAKDAKESYSEQTYCI